MKIELVPAGTPPLRPSESKYAEIHRTVRDMNPGERIRMTLDGKHSADLIRKCAANVARRRGIKISTHTVDCIVEITRHG